MNSSFSGLLVLLGFLLSFVYAETKHYALVATEEVIYPDCTPRLSVVINGTFPGPALYAMAGDHIFIRVYNAASANLTIHWHGISQYGSPFADGTPFASQWPIPPGKYFDYEFQFENDLDGTFWYHSHMGTQTLTCHGALIILPKCGDAANCPCTHINCGRGNGADVWDWIARDWSPTVGTDVTVNVEIDFNGGEVDISASTSVTVESGSGSHAGSGSSGSYVDFGSYMGSSDSNSGSSSSQSGSESSSSGNNQCCRCGCEGNKHKHKVRRSLKRRDYGAGVAQPPYAFDTSCSNSPIPYDEERIVIIEDMFDARDSTLSQTALAGRFLGGANNILLNGKQYAVCSQSTVNGLGYGETCSTNCSFAEIQIEPSKTYLFRIIGATIDSFVGFSIAGHKLQIVQVDGGSWIEPYEADYVLVHAGQRYAVIVEGKSEEELAAYGKDYYYIQMLDYQNGPPPGSGPPASSIGRSAPASRTVSGSGSSGVGPVTSSSDIQSIQFPETAANSNLEAPASISVNPNANNFAAQTSAVVPAHVGTTQTTVPYPVNNQATPTPSTESPQNGPNFNDLTSTPVTPRRQKKWRRQANAVPSAAASASGPGGPGGPGGFGPPPAITAAYGVLTYKTSSGSVPDSVFVTAPNNLTDTMPILPNSTVGAQYQNVTNQFRPYYSNPAPTPNKRIYLNNTADSWGGKERDVLNQLAFYPSPDQVPLLVGMYNGQVVVDNVAQARAAAQGNYFDSQTGAYLLEYGDVVEVVFQNQVGGNGVVIHPFHMHGGDFWDMGGSSGQFTEEAYQQLQQEVDPVKRDTTLLSAMPSSFGASGNPQGWRVWRWEATNPGVWMLHCHIVGHMLLGLQTMVVVGQNSQLPPLTPAYENAYLSYGQAGAMGNVNNDTTFIPYFITANSTDPTWENS